MEQFVRTAALIGPEALERLKNAKIALFGVGGVGAAALEALLRTGVYNIDVFDNDTVSESNLNRQLIADKSTVGMPKTDAAERLAATINPAAKIGKFNIFYLSENADTIDLSCYDYIIDAIDTVSAKLELAVRAEREGIPLISVMGTGNKLDPTLLAVTDIYKTRECPLCRVMRSELKKRGVKRLLCVFSTEVPHLHTPPEGNSRTPASAPFVPIAAGMAAAARVVQDLIK